MRQQLKTHGGTLRSVESALRGGERTYVPILLLIERGNEEKSSGIGR